MKCLLNSNIVKEKRFRIAGAITLSVFVIAVIIICSTVLRSGDDPPDDSSTDVPTPAPPNVNSTDVPSTTPPDANSTDVPSPFTKALIVQLDNTDLWALDIDTYNSSFIVRNWKDGIHSFDCYMKKTIYIGSQDAGKPVKSLSGKYRELSQPTDWVADKIAVDYVDGKVYTLDVAVSSVNIFDALGEHYTVVMSHLRGPKDIALDSIKRLIFILQSSSIITANIDGSSPKTIVDTTALTSFTIDHERKIYYADLENIISVNYVGQEQQIVTKISGEVIGIAALENNVFWRYRSSNSDHSILYSCKIVNGNCKGVSEIKLSGILMQLKAYNFEETKTSNPCKDQVHGCDHMCIMNSAVSSRCACSIGWQLDIDSKRCKEAEDFLLHIEGNYVKSQILDDTAESFTGAMLPLKLNSSFSIECNFDFDVRQRKLIFSDGRDMYQKILATNSEQIKVGSINTPELSIPAIDWISQNLYYLSVEVFTSPVGNWQVTNFKVHRLESSESFDNDKIIHSVRLIYNVTSLVVHPIRGLLFYTTIWYELFSLVPEIHKIHLDGSSHSEYPNDLTVSAHKNVLAIDCEDDRLYWFSEDKKVIHFADLDGNAVKSIDIKFVSSPITMSIYKSLLYVSTAKSVWRLDKATGENAIQVLPKFQEEYQRIFGAKIFSRTTQPIYKNHPCARNNGDCQRYCFGVPLNGKKLQKVCACLENEKLNPDGKTCYST